ncbi:MAG: DNA-binding response OmpR family regulator [Moritella sp.]|jgi:DNA-binding response OmpR family regulator
MKILLVEDHQDIAGIIFDFFEIKGYTLDYAKDGVHGYELACNNYYDLIILDVMMPRMDGLTVCQKLRSHGDDTPILMLTARDTREDTLAGFDCGADDYLIKPFDLDILAARIQALHRRRSGKNSVKALSFNELKLDLTTHIATRNECNFELNPTQFTILKLLMMRKTEIVTKGEIIHAIWGHDEPDGDVLRSHIYQLRNQVDKPFKQHYIKTIPKIGYHLVEGY